MYEDNSLLIPEPLDHKHILVKATINNTVVSADRLSQWLTELVEAVGMKVFIPAQSVRCDTLGNEGVTGIICLETSHASVHVWDAGYLQFDLYSCKTFDVQAITDHLKLFDPVTANFALVDRNANAPIVIMEGFRIYDPIIEPNMQVALEYVETYLPSGAVRDYRASKE